MVKRAATKCEESTLTEKTVTKEMNWERYVR